MEEKRKKSVAKKNELEILAKKMALMRKICHRLEFVSFSNTKGSDWYRKKKIISGKDIKTQRRVNQKIKLMEFRSMGTM